MECMFSSNMIIVFMPQYISGLPKLLGNASTIALELPACGYFFGFERIRTSS